jgi:hypothetical protein
MVLILISENLLTLQEPWNIKGRISDIHIQILDKLDLKLSI